MKALALDPGGLRGFATGELGERDPITIFGLDPLGLLLIALGCVGWLYGRRRP